MINIVSDTAVGSNSITLFENCPCQPNFSFLSFFLRYNALSCCLKRSHHSTFHWTFSTYWQGHQTRQLSDQATFLSGYQSSSYFHSTLCLQIGCYWAACLSGQVHSLWVGSGGIYLKSFGWTLQSILSTHNRLEVPGLLFSAYLIVITF